MSDEKIKTKKKDKSFWKELGEAALAVTSLVFVLKGNNKTPNSKSLESVECLVNYQFF